MDTLLEFIPRIRALGGREAVRSTDGMRTRIWSYEDLDRNIARFAEYLRAEGLGPGDRLLLWSENCPEWIAVFWACLTMGVIVVPIDAHSSEKRVSLIEAEATTRLRVAGQRRSAARSGTRVFEIERLADLPLPASPTSHSVNSDDIVEILYTSGTTATPKGVLHRHRNICANLTSIAREIERYRRWARLFQPIRFLNMVPLSHMFGQSMGLFIPPLLGGSLVFMKALHPAAIRRTIHSERVSILVTVPHALETLRDDTLRRHPEARLSPSRPGGILRRCWRFRRIHRDFGWKFWCFVVGGAQLAPQTEEFWSRVALLVVQGYGLTETSPVVAVNHPFRARRGTVGRSLGGQEIRVSPDGEIWVRGPSVVEEYVEQGTRVRPTTDAEGWFHTGDLGEIDAEGNLIYRGRKKDVIVTADGLNVHPSDVEQILNRLPEIRDSTVVGVAGPHGEVPHAVLILETPDADVGGLIEKANRALEPEQRLRGWSLWPEEDFPRTPSTQKIQRRLVRDRIDDISEPQPDEPKHGHQFSAAVAELTGRQPAGLSSSTHLAEDLGLSSLERIDLLAALEERYGIELDEEEFSRATTLGSLETQIGTARSHRMEDAEETGMPEPGRLPPPRYSRTFTVKAFREILHATVLRPLLACWVTLRVSGIENLEALGRPVLFAANHASHLDVPLILSGLPKPWRRRVAPAVREEYFSEHRFRLRGRLEYLLATMAFNAYPLPQNLGRVRESLRYTGELIDRGYCPLVFPEGRRTLDGHLGPFRPGTGFMAIRLGLPVVPLRLEGAFEVLPVGARWPRRGRVHLRIGGPVTPDDGESYTAFTARLESALNSL